MPSEFVLMAFSLLVCLSCLALIKIEDVFNFAELSRHPIQNLILGIDHFRQRATRLVRLYQIMAIVAAASFLVCCLSIVLRWLTTFFGPIETLTQLTEVSIPLEASFAMFLVLVLLLLILLMKIESVWVFTTIETKGWEHHSEEALRLDKRVEKRMRP